jgi:hypothetical protein
MPRGIRRLTAACGDGTATGRSASTPRSATATAEEKDSPVNGTSASTCAGIFELLSGS